MADSLPARAARQREYLGFYSDSCTFSNALSPVQAATILRAFEIVDSPEGRQLRRDLMRNVTSLRDHLTGNGMEVYGNASAIVCVRMGAESLARLVSRRLPELGLIANLVEFSAVAKGAAWFRMQVMAGRTEENVRAAVERLRTAVEAATAEAAWVDWNEETAPLRAIA